MRLLAIVLGMLAFSAGDAAAAGYRLLAINDQSPGGNSVSVIDTETDEVTATVPTGPVPFAGVVTPDGRRAVTFNTHNFSGGVDNGGATAIDFPPGAAPVSHAEVPLGPGDWTFGALNPAGDRVFATTSNTNEIKVVDVTKTPLEAVDSFTVPDIAGVPAVTPDGRTLLVVEFGGDEVRLVDLANPDAPNPSTIPVAADARFITLTPDGRKALVTHHAGDRISVIDLMTRVVTPVTRPTESSSFDPNFIAVSADGASAWVTSWQSGAVTRLDLTTNTLGAPIDVPGEGWGVAVTPDGRKLYVSDGSGSTVRVIDLTTSPPTVKPTPVQVQALPRFLIMTPDQAPVAAMSIASAPGGRPTRFDASATTVEFGTISRYDWDFGDGTTTSTTGPTVEHVYARDGTYQASVTATSSGGTSLTTASNGSTMIRNGGPSARVTRSVVVSGSPQPAVALDVTSLDVGKAPIGRQSAERLVRVSNTGTADLRVSRVAITGRSPGAFRVATDECTGRPVAPGSSCRIGVAMVAGGPGSHAATLEIHHDATGSPHTVSLLGSIANIAALRGVVRREAGGAPLEGVGVRACIGSGWDCRQAFTGRDGRYAFDDLRPASYQLSVSPGFGLMPASAVVTLPAGADRTHDFELHPPRPLRGGVTITTPFGTRSDGVPSMGWDDPLTISVPVPIPARGEPNSLKMLYTRAGLVADASRPDGGGIEMMSGLVVTVRYDAAGEPDHLEEVIGGVELPARGSGGFAVAPTARAAQSRKDGEVLSPPRDTFQFPPRELFDGGMTLRDLGVRRRGNRYERIEPVPDRGGFGKTGNGGFVMPIPICDQRYVLYVGPVEQNQYRNNPVVNFLNKKALGPVNTKIKKTADLIDFARNPDLKRGKELVKDFAVPKLNKNLRGAANVAVDHFDGTLEPKGSGGKPRGRAAQAGDPNCEHSDSSDVYIDPSGTVQTPDKLPIPGARVVLERSDTPAQRPVPVPDRSAIMSPRNRRNPDLTDAFGRFSWDVVNGFYRVVASRRGCTEATTPLLEVPPPRLDLIITMRCPQLRRARTQTTLRLRREGTVGRNTAVFAEIRVRAARPRRGARAPTGTIALRDGRRTVASMPVGRRGRTVASLVLPRGRRSLRAAFQPAGLFRPSRSRTVRVR